MNAAIDTLEEHYIHLLHELRNGIDDLHACRTLLLSELLDAVLAGRHIGAAGITRDDLDAAQFGVFRLVEDRREARHMRCVQSDDARAQLLEFLRPSIAARMAR